MAIVEKRTRPPFSKVVSKITTFTAMVDILVPLATTWASSNSAISTAKESLFCPMAQKWRVFSKMGF